MEHKSENQPVSCPQCGSDKVARIHYGRAKKSKEFKADMEAGRVVFGKWTFSLHKPEWRCIDCGSEFYSTAG
jgi:transposase-like protein